MKNIRKTKLLKVSVDDLDIDIPVETAKGPIFLREKTFNSDLGFLLNKISSNEKQPAVQSVNDDNNIDFSLKQTALLEIEKMIYRLKHLEETADNTSHFDPFDIDVDVYDEIDDLNDYIISGMKQSGMNKFLLMRFNLSDNAFRTDINMIREDYTPGIFFGLKDGIIEQMKNSSSGIIIPPDRIRNDKFLIKKFKDGFSSPEDIPPFYICRISSICRESCKNTFYEEKMSGYDDIISPVLVIELDKTNRLMPEDIFGILTRYAAIPLGIYMMNYSLKTAISKFNYRDTLLLVELIANSSDNSSMQLSIIQLENYSSKEYIFIFTFLLSRIKKLLNRNSLFIRVDIDQTLLVCSVEELAAVNAVIEDINRNAEIITIASFDNSRYACESQFLRLFL
ncbi:MAG TPA: hypothetical protein PK514_13225 [Spirochaetota bacterium]|nr:hypothetical protein [Spirochaetota bacterium]